MFFNLFKKECRQILSSLVFYIYIVLFVLFMASQMNEVDVVSMPEPGQQDYGYTYTSDKTAIMEGTLTDLFMDIDNSTFDTYPWGVLKTVVPDKDDLKKLTDILERCTGCSMDELADMEYEWVQNAGGETDQGFTIPLADDLDYDTFLAEMAKVCGIVGKGSSYEKSSFESTTRVPMTYDQAMKSFNEICDIDHVTDSYMRLFCDYASIMLGLLPIFVMVLIPVLILAFAMELPYIYQAHTLGVVPHYLSFLKYTVIWLIPITAWIMALSYLLAELTNGVIAVIAPALYVFLSDLSSSILVGNWGPETHAEMEYIRQCGQVLPAKKLVILSIISSSGGTIAYSRLFAGSFAEIIFLGHFALFQTIRGTYGFIPWMLVLSAVFFIVGTICNEHRS